MDAIEGSPEYQPTLWQKVTSWIGKRAPYAIGRVLQFIMYWLWKGVQFVIQMFRDAIGK